MSSTIYPVLGTCLMSEEEFHRYVKKIGVKDNVFDGEALVKTVILERGISPVKYDSDECDSICLWDRQQFLSKVSLPDGTSGNVYVDDEDYTGVYFVHDDYGKKFQLLGFCCKERKLTVTYAWNDDLVMYYRYRHRGTDPVCMGTVVTAEMYRTPDSFSPYYFVSKGGPVPPEDSYYIYATKNACVKQGFEFDELEFRRVVPVPVSSI